MPFVEAKEYYPVPVLRGWCIASSASIRGEEKFQTATSDPREGNNMTAIYNISFVGVGLILLGLILMMFDVSDGNFVAGTGCLLFAVAGIWAQLRRRRHSQLNSQ